MWQSRPVFISSTFADMQAERDYLRTRVFPELEERLRGRRHNLEWVDLRVGVATASERDEHVREVRVLKVCLDEVRRCRPFLIVLLGDRYGWVPPEERIKAAAEEARGGFSADVGSRSVTDLEIEFGVLSDPEQQPRSFFYFREPLPYADMPADVAALYCEDYAADPGHADRKERLTALKRRIGEQLPTRVRRYAAAWDAEQSRATGLEDFGHMVLDDIWSELEAETATFTAAADIPWQQAEREALEDFIDDRARDFVGRQSILDSLTGLATAAEAAGVMWGACVTGDPGSGKSALFGALYRRLHGRDVFLLAHAAGTSVNAASVDSMLRRWIGELAGALGVDPGLAENADPDTVDATFARLLGQMAQRQRAVVLVDALDQFENTNRGRYVTWLPRLWPANARLIATAIAGDASKTLAERQGVKALPLPALDAAEARDIIAGICRRYHRNFEPEVVEALLAKRGPDGPAWGNPLWLVLAVEDLNLLDADDFARAHHDYTGAPAERLRALMLDTVAGYPPDIPGLYAHTFARAEDLFGASLVRGFLGLIAVSRSGWRESDFRILLPRASGENWDELQFAQLRRLFRGQMRRRGALTQWDFNHAQMRAAVRALLAAWRMSEQNLHTIVADRLLSCSSDDPLHISETMVHLLSGEDYARGAGYYGSSLSEGEVQGATLALTECLLNGTIDASRLGRLLYAKEVDDSTKETLIYRFISLSDSVQSYAASDLLGALAYQTTDALERRLQRKPGDRNLEYLLSISYLRLGSVKERNGDLIGAEAYFRRALALLERLDRMPMLQMAGQQLMSAYNPDVESARGLEDLLNSWKTQLAIAYQSTSRVVAAQGKFEKAVALSQAGLEITKLLAEKAPNDGAAEGAVAAACNRLGYLHGSHGDNTTAEECYDKAIAILERLVVSEPAKEEWQNELAIARTGVGDIRLEQGELSTAKSSFQKAMVLAEGLAKRDPANVALQHQLAAVQERLSRVNAAAGTGFSAEDSSQTAEAITERLARFDPRVWEWRTDLAGHREDFGDVQYRKGDLASAEAAYRSSLAIREQLAALEPRNVNLQLEIASSHLRIGDVQTAHGDFAAAEASLKLALSLVQQLAQQDPGNQITQHNLATVYDRIGTLQRKRDDLAASQNSYRAALEIQEKLVEKYPANLQWLRDLSVSFGNLGEVEMGLKNFSNALRLFNSSMEIRRGLVQQAPDKIDWQGDLAAAYLRVGNALLELQQDDKALSSYQQSFAIREKLIELDPGNKTRQSDLSFILTRIAQLMLAIRKKQ
jgi:tetratricopeptide (TPR) repeat protein